jgi:hypothetical protein
MHDVRLQHVRLHDQFSRYSHTEGADMSGTLLPRFVAAGALATVFLTGQATSQDVMAAATPASNSVQGAASIPDFSGIWWHQSLPGFEPLASGPRPVTNKMRRNGVADYRQWVGDYTNPILKPVAAEAVKKYGEVALGGQVAPSPANQCWPEPLPFIYKNFAIQLLQQPHQITILYEQDHEVRHVRMNQPHPAQVKPSWYGDSVGHYEGDTLVIDTVGTKANRPHAMIDMFGTPYTEKLHVMERYRLIDFEEAKDGLARDAEENWRPAGPARSTGKHLQIHFTVEDEGVFTTPWSATITYGRGSNDWPEIVCAENVKKYYEKDTAVPTADKLDF